MLEKVKAQEYKLCKMNSNKGTKIEREKMSPRIGNTGLQCQEVFKQFQKYFLTM